MRIVRVLLAGILVLIGIAAAVVALVFHNEEALVRILLQRIDASTGYNVVPSAVRVSFRDHLRVTLEQPRVYQDGAEIARLDDILAVVSYHLIFKNKGLPLRELRLNRPVGHVPAAAASDVGYAIPRPDVAGVQSLLGVLNAIGDFSSQIDLYDAKLMDPGGQTIVEHFDFLAKREHRRVPHSPWLVSFDGAWRYPPMGAFRLSGNAHLGTAKQALTGVLWSSDSWFWDLHLANVAPIQGVTATGTMQGKLHLVLNQNGTLEGHALADLTDGVLNGPAFTHPLALGSFSMTADYDISEPLFNLAKVEITRDQALLVAGSCAVTNPYDPARKVALRISGIKVALARVASDLQSIGATPPALIDLAKRVNAGHLEIEQALISPAVPFKDWGVTTIRDNLKLGAIVKGAGFDLKSPQEPNLPSVSHLEAGMTYDKGMVQITQGSATFGQSSLSGINAQTRITRAPRTLPYSLRFKSQLNFNELYPLAMPFISKLAPHAAEHIQNVQGDGALRVQTSGTLEHLAWSPPRDYVAELSPNHIQASIKGIPQHLTLVGGDVTASPGQIHVDHLVMAPARQNGGSVTVNGTVLTDSNMPQVHDLTVELDGLRAEQWIPLIVARDDLAIDGALGGKLTANSDHSGKRIPTVTGVVTLTDGQVQLGFVRSPMMVNTGSLALDGKGLVFDLPNALLEGHSINYKVTLADFDHPALQINALATNFDFEVLRFIRLPWSPKTPVHFFPFPVEGHIAAKQANFDKLQLTAVSTDFTRAHDHWQVTNFKATTLGGNVTLNLSGRSADEWINAHGAVGGIDMPSVFALTGDAKPPLTGKLDANFDIWGNTDVNFFQTLDGKLSLQLSHGLVRRLALLTRVLSLIDLKNWLTAHLPDPRIAGIPFDTITADFKGHDGNMYTDNFRLNGPVMVITSRGNLNLGNQTMDMELSLIPFDTYNWLLTKIPLIGSHIAGGTNDLLAAYFHVYGPVTKPRIVPKPITSVAAFVAKTLSIPINVIRPHTINP